MKLFYEIIESGHLKPSQRSEMYQLFISCYDHVTPQAFESDLSSKTLAILLLNETRELMGFSTQEIYQFNMNGSLVNVLFSGDTVITPSCWGTQELVKGWCEVAAQMLKTSGEMSCYWFLISKGYRTYLYLPLFFNAYHPRPSGHEANLKEILDQLAEARFPGCYDPTNGLIRFPVHCGQLGSDLAEVPHHRDQNGDVQFFLARNPDYAAGVELACLAPINIENTHGLGRRMLGHAMKRLS